MLSSHPCVFADYGTPWYRDRLVDLGEGFLLHRKQWEFAAIAQALGERGVLAPGKAGVGYAIGDEPLAALFAARGCTVVGTDQAPTAAAVGSWGNGQLCAGLDAMNRRGLCDAAAFRERCSFRHVDMTDLPPDLGPYDFCWSACAFEHLGSIEAGLEFVARSSRLLKPGGVAAHTTEFNCSSNEATVERGGAVLYRRRDIERLGDTLRGIGCTLAAPSWETGGHPLDLTVDRSPLPGGPVHLKLELLGYTVTSYLLLITRD